MGKSKKTRLKKAASAIAGVVVCAAIALSPLPGLSDSGCMVLGILACAIVWWVFSVLPEYVTALLMAVAMVLVAGIDGSIVFSAFSSSTWWLLVGAFGLGIAMQQSGLLDRIAQAIVKLFPSRFAAQSFAIMLVGTLIGPLIPAMNAKTAMLAPLAQRMGEKLGYKPFSKQMTGMFLSMLVGVRNVAPFLISASVAGYVVLGLLPDQVQQQFDMLSWARAALPWFLFVWIANYLLIVRLYGNRAQGFGNGVAVEGEGSNGGSAKTIGRDDHAGPMSRRETCMAVIMVATAALWVTESVHGVPAYLVAIVALCACGACGIINRVTFRSGIIWDSLVFTGVVLGLAPVFSSTGVDTWIVSKANPFIVGLAGEPVLFVVGIALATVAIRFVIASEMAFLNVFLAFMVPVAVSVGVNPWIVGFAAYTLVGSWFTLYQNPVYLAGYFAVDGKMSRHVDNALYCVVYCAICIVGLIVSVPYWLSCGIYWLA